MLVYLTELSKYIILILMIFYTLDAFIAVFRKEVPNLLFIRQEICLFLIQFVAYATICLKSGKLDYLFFYAILQLVIFSAIVLNQTIYTDIDKSLLNNMALLLSFGFIIIVSIVANIILITSTIINGTTQVIKATLNVTLYANV